MANKIKKNKTTLHPKLYKCIEEMLINVDLDYQYYGEFAGYINFYLTRDMPMPTMGVNISKEGMNFYYDDRFVEKLSQKEVNYAVIHEILHLIFKHPKRTTTNYNKQLSNIAQDMIINHIIDTDFSSSFTKRPKGLIELSKEYKKMVDNNKAKLYFENLYDFLIKKQEEYEDEKSKNGQGQQGQGQEGQDGESGQGQEGQGGESGQGQEGQGGEKEDKDGKSGQGQNKMDPNAPDENGQYPNGKQSKIEKQLRDIFDRMKAEKKIKELFDNHMENEVDEDYAKEMVEQVKQGLKARGLERGNVETVLEKLQRKRKDHLKEIKRSVAHLFGRSIKKTITLPSILGKEGLKGKKRTGKGLNVILDSSGSMYGEFEKTLSFIFQRNVLINLIQVDTQVQDYVTIDNMKDFKKLKIKGLGGTVLQPGIDYIKEKPELENLNLLILTDGYTDELNFNGLKGCKKALVLTTASKCPISPSNSIPVKQIKIED